MVQNLRKPCTRREANSEWEGGAGQDKTGTRPLTAADRTPRIGDRLIYDLLHVWYPSGIDPAGIAYDRPVIYVDDECFLMRDEEARHDVVDACHWDRYYYVRRADGGDVRIACKPDESEIATVREKIKDMSSNAKTKRALGWDDAADETEQRARKYRRYLRHLERA